MPQPHLLPVYCTCQHATPLEATTNIAPHHFVSDFSSSGTCLEEAGGALRCQILTARAGRELLRRQLLRHIRNTTPT